jgi:hypothetical protein
MSLVARGLARRLVLGVGLLLTASIRSESFEAPTHLHALIHRSAWEG